MKKRKHTNCIEQLTNELAEINKIYGKYKRKKLNKQIILYESGNNKVASVNFVCL